MPRRLLLILAAFFFLVSVPYARAEGMKPGEMKPGEFLVLTYHAVPLKGSDVDNYTVPQSLFAEQMEYLRTHGYHPVSLDDIEKAAGGGKELPPKPVLLTFDDGYVSYHDYVVPLLEKYGYPSVVAIVSNFIENPPKDLPEPVMSWEQIRNVASKKLVEVVSHTHDLHKSIRYNLQGNVGSAVSVWGFDPAKMAYESDDEYRGRIKTDFEAQDKLFREKLGFAPKAIVWPYGRYNAISLDVALRAGYRFGLCTEEGFAHISRLGSVNRNFVTNFNFDPNISMQDFIRTVKNPGGEAASTRTMQVDLDLVYDADPEKMDQNLGKLIDRLVEMKVNTVFLQAFADPEGNGNIKSVYFANRVLPVRADFFSHAVHQMIIRGMHVYAWMPTLSIELPDKGVNERLRVREASGGATRPSKSWYNRLSPFSGEAKELVRTLYADLAAHSQIHGVLFQDDAYLTDFEDFHPSAVAGYEAVFGKKVKPEDLRNNPEMSVKWARYKTEALIDYTKSLMDEVKKYRPEARFARNLYAEPFVNREAEAWFAQNYELFVKSYDQVVLMAYPQMEKAAQPAEWLQGLVNKVKAIRGGLEKTVFKVQTYDWAKKAWLDDGIVLQEMRDILSSGGRHIAYYPDNFWENKPTLAKIKLEMSTRDFPFMPRGQ